MACGKVEWNWKHQKSYFLRHLLCDGWAAVLHVPLPLHVCYAKISGLGELRRNMPPPLSGVTIMHWLEVYAYSYENKSVLRALHADLFVKNTSRVFPPLIVRFYSFSVLYMSFDHYLSNLPFHLLPRRLPYQLASIASVARLMQQITDHTSYLEM